MRQKKSAASRTLFCQRFDCRLIDIQKQFDAIDCDVFVRLVLDRFIAFHFGPERDAVFERSRICTAADRKRRFMSARYLFICIQKCLNERAVLILHEGRLMPDGFVFHADPVDAFDHFRIGDGGGVADIADDLHLALAVFDHIGREREPARFIFQFRDMVEVMEQTVDDIAHPFALSCKKFKNGQDGVLPELRRRTVRRFAVRDDFFVADLQAEFPCAGQRERAGGRGTFVAHHVGAGTSFQKEEGGLFVHREMQTDVQDAFFGIDDREIAVGGESLLGHGCHFVVVLNARPAVFFIAADDEFDLPFGGETFIFERLERIQHAHDGAFVVDRAPAPDLSVRDFSAERIFRPAVSGGDDVEMRQNRELRPVAEDDFAAVIVVIVRLEPKRPRKGKEVRKTVCRALAERRCGRGVCERGIKSNALGDTFHGLLKKISHTASPINHIFQDYTRIIHAGGNNVKYFPRFRLNVCSIFRGCFVKFQI